NIVEELQRNSNQRPGLPEKLSAIQKLVDAQIWSNAKVVSSDILKAIAAALRENHNSRGAAKFYVETALPALREHYQHVSVIFGPGLGLGDQITFYTFLKGLFSLYPNASTTIYTLYPGLWRNLMPAISEIQYRQKPLRPFYKLMQQKKSLQGELEELVIVADFDNFNFHNDNILCNGRDVLEIALGKAGAWLNRHDDPWTRFERFNAQHSVGNNYFVLAKLADRLLPAGAPHNTWTPAADFADQPRTVRTIFLNPFTSKKYDLSPEDWHRLLMLIGSRLNNEVEWNVLIFPGLNEQSQEYARRIWQLCKTGTKRISATVMQSPDRKYPTVYNTFDLLLKHAPAISLCITVDTFTGHFIPLYGIPSIVVTDRDNRAFWVPDHCNFYCLLPRMKVVLPSLAAHILMKDKQVPADAAVRTLISKLIDHTDTAALEGIDHVRMAAVQELLFTILQELPAAFPYANQGHQWLLRWGQLAAASKKSPVTPTDLLPYIEEWRQTEFFKLLTLI
ncbi:MAG TPA: hypothetical protein VFZ47_04470, partial [Chitinophagaceae bacterium]